MINNYHFYIKKEHIFLEIIAFVLTLVIPTLILPNLFERISAPYHQISSIIVIFIFLYTLFFLIFIIKMYKQILFKMMNFLFVFLYVAFFIFWLAKIEIPINMLGNDLVINDQQMIVLTTLLYTYLTYLNIKTSSNIFKYQRFPSLDIKRNGLFFFAVENTSVFSAKDVVLDFDIIFPTPTSEKLDLLKWFFKHEYHKYFTRKNTATFEINSLKPGENKSIDIEDLALRVLKIEKKQNCRTGLDYYISSDGNLKYFSIVAATTQYSSEEGLFNKQPHYKIYEYKFKLDKVEFIQCSDDPIRVC